MKKYDVVIVGGSAAGIPAAITARRYYPKKSIALIRKEGQVLVPCGIPYIFGTLDAPSKNLVSDEVLSKNNIDLFIDKVESIDRLNKSIIASKIGAFSYDKFILATGSEPLLLPIPGINKKNVYFAKKDLSYLTHILEEVKNIKDVVVLGGGFIGVEFADEFKKKGLNVTIVEMLPRCLMLAFEENFCAEAEKHLSNRGINIITNTKIEEILGEEIVTGVKLSNGQELKTDMVFIGVGVKPNTTIAHKAGLEINQSGIIVDNNMRTSDKNIFACGDCITKQSFFTGEKSALRLASIATSEARIAGANLFEMHRQNPGVVGVFSTAIGDLVLGAAGLTKKNAQENDFKIISGEAEGPDKHPASMPGMSKMKVKLLFNKNTMQLIGGQVRGGVSAGEVINVISACIQKKMTADDIAAFQLGTHPALTASPISYQLVNAAELAIMNSKKQT